LEITWSEISDHLSAMAINATLLALVAGGGGFSLFRDHLLTSEAAEAEQKTGRATLQTKVAEAHRRVLNWHMKIIVSPGSAKKEVVLAMDVVDDYTNEIFRSATLLRRLDQTCTSIRRMRFCIFICTACALVGLLLSVAITAVRPFFTVTALILLAVEIWAVVKSRRCKKEIAAVNEAI
jgi:Flp pilus assembly protein TadB